MRYFRFIVIFYLFLRFGLCAQTSHLRLAYSRLGSTKNFDILTNETMEYKLKKDLLYQKKKIVSMQDSMIQFSDNTEIKLNEIKALRLRKNVHLVNTFQFLFFGGAVGFIGLNTLNNVITDTSPVFNEKAVYISAGLLAVGLLVRELGLKRVRMTENKSLKIISVDFQHLNTDSTKTAK